MCPRLGLLKQLIIISIYHSLNEISDCVKALAPDFIFANVSRLIYDMNYSVFSRNNDSRMIANETVPNIKRILVRNVFILYKWFHIY